MSVQVTVQLPMGTVSVEADNIKKAVKELSPYYDVMGETNCGQCQSEDLALMHRNAKGYDFYHLRCLSCGAQLDFGQHQEHETLFPKRKLEDGSFDNEHRGWYRWQDRQQNSSYDGGPSF